MAEKCKYAYRKRGDVSVHCMAIRRAYDYCINMYYCGDSKRYEANDGVNVCNIRKSEDGRLTKTGG